MPDAAFGLHNKVIPPDGLFVPKNCAKMLLANASAINIGVIEEVRAVFHCGMDKPAQRLRVKAAKAHAAHNNGGRG